MKTITSATICGLVASLAAAGTAAADFHIDPSGHGGRTAPATTTAAASAGALTLGGRSHQGQPVVATVSKDRRRLVLNAAYSSSCTSGGDMPLGATTFAAAKVRKGGRYAITKTVRTGLDDGSSMTESYSASGRLRKSSTSGTLRVKDTFFAPDGSVDDVCDSGQQSYKLYRSGMFAGTSSQGLPVVLEYSPGHDRITSLLIPWAAQCKSGTIIAGTPDLVSPVSRDGTFGGSFTDSGDWSPGQTGNATATFGGVLSNRSAVGTWSMAVSVTDASQAEVDSCDTGMIGFRLK
jgi:hypothetical protein